MTLRLLRGRTLVCEVADASPAVPRIRRAADTDESGRGASADLRCDQPVGRPIHSVRQMHLDRTAPARRPAWSASLVRVCVRRAARSGQGVNDARSRRRPEFWSAARDRCCEPGDARIWDWNSWSRDARPTRQYTWIGSGTSTVMSKPLTPCSLSRAPRRKPGYGVRMEGSGGWVSYASQGRTRTCARNYPGNDLRIAGNHLINWPHRPWPVDFVNDPVVVGYLPELLSCRFPCDRCLSHEGQHPTALVIGEIPRQEA